MVSTWTDIREYDEICTKKCMHQKLEKLDRFEIGY